jgi:SHS family lactate transporter-like MFS transporter
MHAVTAAFLGWTLDAFDFFIVVFLVDVLATEFQVSKAAIVWTLTATLATRPVGALLFGLLADRYGRRLPLIASIVFFSVVEVLCGLATGYTAFLILRTLFGIGMGGEWGVGASLAMESAPTRRRGTLSGILQSGYSVGFLLAAVAARFVLPNLGWRAMFFVGGLPALLAIYIRLKVPESEAWRQHRATTVGGILKSATQQWKSVIYMVVLMTFLMFLSHGSQDLYPDFLKTAHHLSASMVANIVILSMIVAVTGGVLFGYLSERIGRRRGMLAALAVSLVAIPAWAFGTTPLVLAVGAAFLQMGVQGAWGIIPAHLNELSPDAARGLVPGLAYQLGILFAAPTNNIEFALRDALGYKWAMAGFEAVVIVLLGTIIALGSERRGKQFAAHSDSGRLR